MKTTKKFVLAAAMLMAVSLESSAQAFNNIWVTGNVQPANSGTIFLFWNQEPDEYIYGATSEFKRSANSAESAAFLWAKPAEGYQFAGAVRDFNRNGKYDADTDRQLWIWANHYFTAFYDHTPYGSGNSTTDYENAKAALENMTTPTDFIVAVFTQGAVGRNNPEQADYGRVYCDKLDNKVGDEVTFVAYADGNFPYIDGQGTDYQKFDHWTNSKGETVGTNRELKVTVTGPEVYYAHFASTNKADYQANEKVPDQYKFDYSNPEWDGTFDGIETVKAAKTADSAIYNINGQRVAQPTKGLFIQNGKKFVVK